MGNVYDASLYLHNSTNLFCWVCCDLVPKLGNVCFIQIWISRAMGKYSATTKFVCACMNCRDVGIYLKLGKQVVM